MHIRRFSPDLKTKIPGGHPGLYGVPIQFDRANLPTQNMDELSLFLVTRGTGFVRIGGPTGETQRVTAGDAILWPAGLDHKVWAEDEPLEAIVIDGPPEREEASS